MLINVLPGSSYQVSENDLYSSISGVVVFVSRWMLFVSFLRHSPSHFPEGNLVSVISTSMLGVSREPLNAGPSCIRICAGLHNTSGTQPQKPINTRKPKHTKNHTRNQLRRTPKRKTPAQQQQSTHSKQAPSTKSSIRVYQSTGV